MNIGYVYYLVIILLVSGYLIIRIDSRFYEKEQMDKEKKVAKFLGRTNIVLGVLLLFSNWVINTWFR